MPLLPPPPRTDAEEGQGPGTAPATPGPGKPREPMGEEAVGPWSPGTSVGRVGVPTSQGQSPTALAATAVGGSWPGVGGGVLASMGALVQAGQGGRGRCPKLRVSQADTWRGMEPREDLAWSANTSRPAEPGQGRISAPGAKEPPAYSSHLLGGPSGSIVAAHAMHRGLAPPSPNGQEASGPGG